MSTAATTPHEAPHGDGHDASLAAPDKPFNGVILASIVFVLATVLVFVFGTYQLFEYTTKAAVQSVELSPVDQRLSALRAKEKVELDEYRWLDKKNDVVRIPAERAEQLVQREWATRPTGTVANPVGLPAATPAPANPPPAAPAPVTPAKPLHPEHRMGLPTAPNAPGKKAPVPAKPKAN